MKMGIPGARYSRHGLARRGHMHPLYRVWQGMRRRCLDPVCKHYSDYGGRGVTVCERWNDSFEAFLADMGERPTAEHQLDRYPDNDGNYEPSNCRWAVRSANCRNRRSNKIIEFAGERLCISDWAERVGLSFNALQQRLKNGWAVDRALTEPLHKQANRAPTHGNAVPACARAGVIVVTANARGSPSNVCFVCGWCRAYVEDYKPPRRSVRRYCSLACYDCARGVTVANDVVTKSA
jgi:hypothetical protein